MEHPAITMTNRTGYPSQSQLAADASDSEDYFGHKLYPGDVVIDFDDFVVLASEVSTEVESLLEDLGGTRTEIK